MKTFHRLMYENLTKDEYKELCRLGNVFELRGCGIKPRTDFSNAKPEEALDSSFYWGSTPQGER